MKKTVATEAIKALISIIPIWGRPAQKPLAEALVNASGMYDDTYELNTFVNMEAAGAAQRVHLRPSVHGDRAAHPRRRP